MIFGITGSIACGKSTVSNIFRKLGVHIIDADDIDIKEIIRYNSTLLTNLVSEFGTDILTQDGNLNYYNLKQIIYKDSDKVRIAERILYTEIHNIASKKILESKITKPIIGYDDALLIESGEWVKYRPLVVVCLDEKEQIRRLMAREYLTEDQAKIRIAAQLPTAEKAKYADFIIWNDGNLSSLELLVKNLYNDILCFRSS